MSLVQNNSAWAHANMMHFNAEMYDSQLGK